MVINLRCRSSGDQDALDHDKGQKICSFERPPSPLDFFEIAPVNFVVSPGYCIFQKKARSLGSHLYRDTFAELLGSGIVGTPHTTIVAFWHLGVALTETSRKRAARDGRVGVVWRKPKGDGQKKEERHDNLRRFTTRLDAMLAKRSARQFTTFYDNLRQVLVRQGIPFSFAKRTASSELWGPHLLHAAPSSLASSRRVHTTNQPGRLE